MSKGMKLQRPKFSSEISADVALEAIERNFYAQTGANVALQEAYDFSGMHERTAKGDELTVSVSSTSKRNMIKYQLKRDSLYHILPEYLFHPLDRYANIEGDKDLFLEKRAAQKKVEEEAKAYFYPYDKTLNGLRVKFQKYLNDSILENDVFIIDFIVEGSNVNKQNPFIKACLPAVIYLRAMRGSEALNAYALQQVFGDGMIEYRCGFEETPVEIDAYSCHICLDGQIDDLFCGNEFIDWQEVISIKYQTSIGSEDDIRRLNKELEDFSSFFRRWFLTANQRIEVAFGDYGKEPILSNNASDGFLFLNYNTQLSVS